MSDIEVNPFEAAAVSFEILPDQVERLARVGQVVVRWEKLRLLYNLICGLCSLLLGVALNQLPFRSFWEILFIGFCIANACFCCGHLIEGYLAYFFRSHVLVTGLLFVLGTLFTLFMALAMIAGSVL